MPWRCCGCDCWPVAGACEEAGRIMEHIMPPEDGAAAVDPVCPGPHIIWAADGPAQPRARARAAKAMELRMIVPSVMAGG